MSTDIKCCVCNYTVSIEEACSVYTTVVVSQTHATVMVKQHACRCLAEATQCHAFIQLSACKCLSSPLYTQGKHVLVQV